MTTNSISWKDLSSLRLPDSEERQLHDAIAFIASIPKLDSSAASHLERMIRLAESALCKLAEQDSLRAIKAQAASVAVPEVDIERIQLEAGYYRATLRNVLKDIRDDLARGGLPESWKGIGETISVVLEAAPHPVSGEQKAVAVVNEGDDGQFAEILPDVSVRVGDKLYAAPPAAQEVPGLVEALRRLERANDRRTSLMTGEAYRVCSLIHGMSDALLELDAARKQARAALAAQRAQQGEQP